MEKVFGDVGAYHNKFDVLKHKRNNNNNNNDNRINVNI